MPDENTYNILKGMTGDQVAAVIVVIVLVSIIILTNYKKIIGLFNDLYTRRKKKDELNQTILENKKAIEELKQTDIETNKSIQTLQSSFNEAMTEVKTLLADIRRENEDTKIDQLRTDILDFCNACSVRKYKKDAYDHIFDLHETYEKILNKRGLANGQVDASYKAMLEIYKQHVKNGDFVDD